MDVVSPLYILILMGAASIAALFVLWVSGLLLSKSPRHATQGPTLPRDAFFLFHDDRLADMDMGGEKSVDDSMEKLQSWEGFRSAIEAQFPDCPIPLPTCPTIWRC